MLLLDNEGGLLSLERDLRQVENLSQRNVADAGNLQAHQHLQEDLNSIVEVIPQMTRDIQQLESRATVFLTEYQNYVCLDVYIT